MLFSRLVLLVHYQRRYETTRSSLCRCGVTQKIGLRSRLDRQILGWSNATRLRLCDGLGCLGHGSRSFFADGCRCVGGLVHGGWVCGWVCGWVLADLLLLFNSATRSSEQTTKLARGSRLLFGLAINHLTVRTNIRHSLFLSAQGAKERCTALVLDRLRSRGSCCRSRALSRCVKSSAGCGCHSRRTAARSSWGPSRSEWLFASPLGLLVGFDILLLLRIVSNGRQKIRLQTASPHA